MGNKNEKKNKILYFFWLSKLAKNDQKKIKYEIN